VEFSVGDKVVHPGRGCGQIIGLEHLDLVEGFERYYVIEFPDKGLTVHVPVRKAEEVGVRPVMSRDELARVLDTLRARPRSLSEDFRERETRIREGLKTGQPLRLAEIVRDLTWLKRHAPLTKADRELLARGREFLSAEIALASGTDFLAAKRTIDAALPPLLWRELGIRLNDYK
jgi:CarD family transcriptional regulator